MARPPTPPRSAESLEHNSFDTNPHDPQNTSPSIYSIPNIQIPPSPDNANNSNVNSNISSPELSHRSEPEYEHNV